MAMTLNDCDKMVGVLSILIIISIIICFAVTKKQNFDWIDFVKDIGPRRAVHPLKGYDPQVFKESPFKQSWNVGQSQTFPLIGFNQTGVPLSTMPPHIPTPREYFNKPRTGAAAVLPTDVSTVKNALSQGNWAIANGRVRIPSGMLRNKLYHSWGSETLHSQRNTGDNYVLKTGLNLDSPSFQCGSFLPRDGGMEKAKQVCSNTPACIGIVTDTNNNPICLKSSSEQQRFYGDSNANFYEKISRG